MNYEDRSPVISVLMGVYNTPEQYLRAAVESILCQTIPNFEFIIVLDSPTDNSGQIVRSYVDSRIIILENTKNCGLAFSLNRGISAARGKYVARMDTDDIALPQRLKEQLEYMESHEEVAVLGTGACFFHEDGVGKSWWPPCGEDWEAAKVHMLFYNAGIAHPTAFIRRSFLQEHMLCYDEELRKAQDYRLWIDVLLAGGKIRCLPDVLLKYRQHDGQITHQSARRDYPKEIIRMQLERLLGVVSERDVAVHCAIYEGDAGIPVEACDCHIQRLIGANNYRCLYDTQKFQREIFSIWLLTIVRMVCRHHNMEILRSRFLLRAFSLRIICNVLLRKMKAYFKSINTM